MFLGFISSQITEIPHHRFQILEEREFTRFCLTRPIQAPIIGLFWQPSRSLPAFFAGWSRFKVAHSMMSALSERMQGHWFGR